MKGKRIVITGVSRGLGRAMVDAFLEQDCLVVGISRAPCDYWDDNSRFIGLVADVADPNSVRSAFSQIDSSLGGVDYLFNNAAVYSRVGFLEESSEDWIRDVLINLAGVANCCKAALPLMIENRFGRIYNVGSFADLSPIANSSAYSTSKGGLHALTKSIAADLAPLNIDVQVHEWIPGHLNTRMSDFTGIDPSTSAAWAVEISRANAASANSVIYQNDRELILNLSRVQRIKKRLMFWRSA